MRAYQSWIYTYGPLLAVALAFSIAALVVGERYSMGVETGAGRSVRADLLLLAGSGTALLLTAVMISVYHFRYVLVALPLLPPAGVLGATLLVRRIRPLVEARR